MSGFWRWASYHVATSLHEAVGVRGERLTSCVRGGFGFCIFFLVRGRVSCSGMREGRVKCDPLRAGDRSPKGLGVRAGAVVRVPGRPVARAVKGRGGRDGMYLASLAPPCFGAKRALLGRSDRSNGRVGIRGVGRSARGDEVRLGADAPTPCVLGRTLVCRSGRPSGLLFCREDFIPAILAHYRQKNKSPGYERSVKVAKVSEVGYILVSSRSHQCEYLCIYGNTQYCDHCAR